MFVYLSNAVRARKDVVFVVAVLIVGFLVEGVLMLGVAWMDLDFDVVGLATRSNELVGDASISRVGGTIGSANGAAAYVAMMIPIALSVLWADVPVWVKRAAYLALPVGAIGLILTYSRGGWAAALAGIGVVLLLGSRRRITTGIGACLVVTCVVLVALAFRSEIESRLVGDTQGVRTPRTRVFR